MAFDSICRLPRTAGILLCALLLAGTLRAQRPSEFFRDPSVPPADRASDLVSRLTLSEKVSLLQDASPAVPRLGLPAYTWGNEGLHGDAYTGYMTLFPQVIGMAATFDPELVHAMGRVVATEARARFNLDSAREHGARFTGVSFWAPNINIFRDPRWGRGQETYGEDPFLTARMGVAYITGLQGDDPRYLMALATPKHFAVHSGPEPDRHRWDSVVSPHDLADTYLPAFQAAIREGHAGAVMCSYNRINGVPACANPWLLNDTLRARWGFQGYVISDCGAVGDISQGHHYAADDEHSSAVAILGGLDAACDWVPDGQRSEFSYLLEAVQHGLVPEARVNEALTRVLTARFRLGLLAPPGTVPFSRIGAEQLRTRASHELALRAARESLVLLRNDHAFLPLKGSPTLAVIGPDADLTQAVEGNYNAVPLNPVTPLAGMRARFGASRVLYAQGSPLAEGLPIVVPETVLHPAPGQPQHGLRGEYFANPDFHGAPVHTRLDRTLNFDWDRAEPAPGMPNEDYAVRWTGTFTPPAPGDYELGAKVRGCLPCGGRETLKVYLDGKLLLQEGKQHTAPVHFADASPHALRIEYVHRRVPTHHMVAAGIDLLWRAPQQALLHEAVEAARRADVTVAFVGLSPELEGEDLPVALPGFAGGDRTTLALPAVQQDLLAALAATGRPLVLVLMSGSAVTASAAESARAVLEAWYPGEAGGQAIAETLAGDHNPSGRLPVTFYASAAQLPPFGSYNMRGRTYRYFSGEPWHGFGFGLSYTSFGYKDLALSTNRIAPGESLEATVSVKNTGSVAGDEIVQLFLTPPRVEGAPLRKLVGFARVSLRPGEERRVTLKVNPAQLETILPDGASSLPRGVYRLQAAGAQPQEAASTASSEFEVRP